MGINVLGWRYNYIQEVKTQAGSTKEPMRSKDLMCDCGRMRDREMNTQSKRKMDRRTKLAWLFYAGEPGQD